MHVRFAFITWSLSVFFKSFFYERTERHHNWPGLLSVHLFVHASKYSFLYYFVTLLYCIDIHHISIFFFFWLLYKYYLVLHRVFFFFYCNVNANVLGREREICSSYSSFIRLFLLFFFFLLKILCKNHPSTYVGW